MLDNSSTIMTVSNQWASRPDDQRFVSLPDLYANVQSRRAVSESRVLSNRRVMAAPLEGSSNGMQVITESSDPVSPTHWAFGQLAALAAAPAGYLRKLPSDMASDCINFGLRHMRDVEEIKLLSTDQELRAANGPNYGRIWDEEVVRALMERFGDGVTGSWKVPGEFGKDVPITKANTTIYGSDRDCFIFLCDEKNRIEVPDRRNGEAGSMARGFYVWNSEVGNSTLGAAFFLFDYVCCNRIIWGARDFKEIRIRHTSGAPDRWLENVTPVLEEYARSAAGPLEATIAAAQAQKVEKVDEFLAKRFSAGRSRDIKAAFLADESRPIETLWDAATAVTAFARGIRYQDERVAVERIGGDILDLVAS